MSIEEINKMSTSELSKEISRRMDEIFLMRRELSRRRGDIPNGADGVDFAKYVTK